MSMNTVPERLAALRAAMKANGVDVYHRRCQQQRSML